MKSRLWIPAFALLLAFEIWLPLLHLLFRPQTKDLGLDNGISRIADQLAAHHFLIWTTPDLRNRELAQMRQLNPEWDFMSRTFLILALANIALRDESRVPQCLQVIDLIIENTLIIEQEDGFREFLLGYGYADNWKVKPPRSIFVDGEISLMIGARRMVADRADYQKMMVERIGIMVAQMKLSPVLSAESYPDECWIFCNTIALAAIRLGDVLDKSDHSEFLREWVETAKLHLIEPQSGLLISAYAIDGTPLPHGPGPEGTSIWLASHMLQIVDGTFAQDQYQRAKAQLGRSLLGFGYSREWPNNVEGMMDIDSGPIVPLMEASASASGLAFLGASGFRDTKYLTQLMTSLNVAGFPIRKNGTLRYQASNPVGDAVLLYSLVQGPLWEKAK